MNIFGKKSEVETRVESIKNYFGIEFEIVDTAIEAMSDWVKLESDYGRELYLIKAKLDRIPIKFASAEIYEYFASVIDITASHHLSLAANINSDVVKAFQFDRTQSMNQYKQVFERLSSQ